MQIHNIWINTATKAKSYDNAEITAMAGANPSSLDAVISMAADRTADWTSMVITIVRTTNQAGLPAKLEG